MSVLMLLILIEGLSIGAFVGVLAWLFASRHPDR